DAASSIIEKSLEGEFIPASGGESSVDRYVQEQQAIADDNKPTGVAKYLQDRPDIEKLEDQTRLEKEPVVSGVAKYLSAKQQNVEVSEEVIQLSSVEKYLQSRPEVIKEPEPLSSVERYMAQQAIREKELAIANATGVEKYLLTMAN
ncbi:MAG: hypothetical protein ABGX68_02855, partial [Methylococcales bacterium]